MYMFWQKLFLDLLRKIYPRQFKFSRTNLRRKTESAKNKRRKNTVKESGEKERIAFLPYSLLHLRSLQRREKMQQKEKKAGASANHLPQFCEDERVTLE